MSIPSEFWQGVEQFNQGEFYACHDTLEAIWMEAMEPERAFYQGVLQIAVALYHLGNQNRRGAVILLGEGINRLHRYQPAYNGINVMQLVTESSNLLNTLQQLEVGQRPTSVGQFSQEYPSLDSMHLVLPIIQCIGVQER
jgi:predicted metal-dependent hydrolase